MSLTFLVFRRLLLGLLLIGIGRAAAAEKIWAPGATGEGLGSPVRLPFDVQQRPRKFARQN
jgi:hypothetical protein